MLIKLVAFSEPKQRMLHKDERERIDILVNPDHIVAAWTRNERTMLAMTTGRAFELTCNLAEFYVRLVGFGIVVVTE